MYMLVKNVYDLLVIEEQSESFLEVAKGVLYESSKIFIFFWACTQVDTEVREMKMCHKLKFQSMFVLTDILLEFRSKNLGRNVYYYSTVWYYFFLIITESMI